MTNLSVIIDFLSEEIIKKVKQFRPVVASLEL